MAKERGRKINFPIYGKNPDYDLENGRRFSQ